MVFKKTRKAKQQVKEPPSDEEKGGLRGTDSNSSANRDADENAEDEALEQITKSDSIYTWRNVNYTIPYMGGERQLLHDVNGYAKPGKMVSFIFCSGDVIYILVMSL